MSNEVTTAEMPQYTLVAYNPGTDLVSVRRDPVAYPRINATNRDEAIARMAKMVYAACLYRNQATTKAVVSFTATALVDEILADQQFGLPSLSWMEIGMVIRRAVLGGAKELYGVSVSTLYAALVDYARGEGHEACRLAAQNR